MVMYSSKPVAEKIIEFIHQVKLELVGGNVGL